MPRTASEPWTVQLSVTGMTCAACAARVQTKLNRLDGVSAEVSYATGVASVRAPAELAVDRLVAEVAKAGYQATPKARGRPESPHTELAVLRRRLLVAILCGAPLADLSMSMALNPEQRFWGWQAVLLALAVPVAGWCAWPFHRAAARAARHGATTMDTLVSCGIVASVGWSGYAMFAEHLPTGARPAGGVWTRPVGSIYLDVAAAVTIFLLAGRMFELRARERAGDALRVLAGLRADEVTVRRDGGERRVPLSELGLGEEFVVRPGEPIATDGVVLTGVGAVDTSAMTGEPIPREVGAGDQVVGATVLVSGMLVVRASKVGEQTRLAQLVALVERAQTQKAAAQRLADRVCAYFVPAVLAGSAGTLAVWLLTGGPVQRAVEAAMAVLIIACPCALGLATPIALVVAAGRGAELGIFLTGYRALEVARRIDTVVLDKTGTMTEARLVPRELATVPGLPADQLLLAAGAVALASPHPLAKAVVELARQHPRPLPPVRDFQQLPGSGVCGLVEGLEVLIGSRRLLTERGVPEDAELDRARRRWQGQGLATVSIAVAGRPAAVLALSDQVRPGAAEAVGALHRLGLRTVLATGDQPPAARAVAERVGIQEVLAEVSPTDKAAVVARLTDEGRSVAVVGDGVNDAPALASADLGIAMGSGTDVALAAADLVLVRDDLALVPTALRLARRTLRVIRVNLCWAFGYNVVALPLAALDLLNPIIAGAAMVASSLLVVANSLRLRHVGQPDSSVRLEA